MISNLKALVVDDEEHVRTYIVLVLRKLGIGTILEARNGEQALEMYKQERPDITLMDVNMPVMNGITALQRIIEINPEAVVVMLTSLATRQIVEDSAEHGASHFVRKDTSKENMQKIINEIISLFLDVESKASVS
jgi:two-component system chemotaxis response regulator CheY